MSAFSLMTIGTAALKANYAALQTTGNNIANASVAGYSRQQVEVATAGGQFTGAGFFGSGVDVATVTRSHDAFLTREATLSRAVAASDSARLTQLQQLETLFGTGEAGVGFAAGQLLNSFADVASRPQDLSARQVVLARADELAARFRAGNEQLNQLQDGVTLDLKNSITAVNGLSRQLAAVNSQIAAVRGSGHTPNDMLDERERLIGRIADYLQVTTVAADDGTVSVFVAGGQNLVLGGAATALTAVKDPFDANRVHVGVGQGASERALPDDAFGGGSIAGLLRFQSSDLTDARNMLGQIATVVGSRINEQQSFGLNLLQPASAGTALFALGAPQALASSHNTGGATVALTINNASQLQASDYELRTDPSGTAGAYQITRLSDGIVYTAVPSGGAGNYQINRIDGGISTPIGAPASGIVVDGVRIAITGTPAIDDRFLLQPAAGGPNTMRRVLSDARGIAAASPVTATLGATNSGTASVASLSVVNAGYSATPLTISFTSNSGAWSATNASNAVVASGTWTAGQPISVNGWELQLNGVPKTNDTVLIGAAPNPSSNNGNAVSLLGVRDEAIVGRELLGGGVVSNGQSITNAYSTAMADIGVRVQSAKAASTISGAVAHDAETARANASGVNLDEEAARLIQFQQSYQAAAKVLQVAQAVFDTLLQTTGR
jgi:flagellar hook-associated protein 1 FlgK